MSSILIAYATDHGQTRKVSERIASVLRGYGHEVRIRDVRAGPPEWAADAVLVGGSIRMGKHQRELIAFVRHHRSRLEQVPNAFFSVSLTASHQTPKARKDVALTLARFVADSGWKPQAMVPVAGALVYSEYGFFIRQMLRLISALAGGDTDTSRDYEYTDWAAVDGFARQFAGTLPAPFAQQLAT